MQTPVKNHLFTQNSFPIFGTVMVLVQAKANSVFKTPFKTYVKKDIMVGYFEIFDFLLFKSECCKVNPFPIKSGIWKYKDDCISGCFLRPDAHKEVHA